jgi:hypothetical protein
MQALSTYFTKLLTETVRLGSVGVSPEAASSAGENTNFLEIKNMIGGKMMITAAKAIM